MFLVSIKTFNMNKILFCRAFNLPSDGSSYPISFYSTDTCKPVVAVKSYGNADTMKRSMSLENKGKAGIYRWVNNINGKTYIGSSSNISKRLKNYYNLSCLEKSNMTIYKALLKYGYSNFSFEILEYCDESIVLQKEQYYLDSLAPDYNILKTAGNSLGYKHSEVTKQKISEINQGKTFSEDTLKKISESVRGENNHFFGKNHSIESKEKMSQTKGTIIYQYSLELDLLSSFLSSKAAAKYFKASNSSIMKYARSNYIYKDQYILSLELLNSDFTIVQANTRRIPIYVYSLYGTSYQLLNTFPSSLSAAKYFNCSDATIMRNARSGKIFKVKYILSLKELSSSDSS